MSDYHSFPASKFPASQLKLLQPPTVMSERNYFADWSIYDFLFAHYFYLLDRRSAKWKKNRVNFEVIFSEQEIELRKESKGMRNKRPTFLDRQTDSQSVAACSGGKKEKRIPGANSSIYLKMSIFAFFPILLLRLGITSQPNFSRFYRHKKCNHRLLTTWNLSIGEDSVAWKLRNVRKGYVPTHLPD